MIKTCKTCKNNWDCSPDNKYNCCSKGYPKWEKKIELKKKGGKDESRNTNRN